MNTEVLISETFEMCFKNYVSWKKTQKEGNDLCRVYSHLLSRYRTCKKKNFKTIRCYLRYLTISNSGLLVHQRSNLFYPTFEAIAVPQNV